MKEYFIKYRAIMNALDTLETSDRADDDSHYRVGVMDAKITVMQLLSDDDACTMVSTEKELEK